MSYEVSAGGYVFREKDGGFEVLMIQDRYGWWTLPKGHIEGDETPLQAAKREVLEETGVEAEFVGYLPTVYYVFWTHGKRAEKFVHYYLMRADAESTPQPQLEEIRRVDWVALSKVDHLKQYSNNQPVMQAAASILEKSGRR